MKNIISAIMLIISVLCMNKIQAQGPPITADKPIMLGGGTKLIKTLSEFRKTESGEFLATPIMLHYLPTSNSLIGIHVPLVKYSFSDPNLESGTTLGDIVLLGKYQFYRKDQMGKTFRLVAKTLQTLPTGKALALDGISTDYYQSYQGIVAGYETLKYGISNELGYNLVPNNNRNEMRYKLGFGLPLLKPRYPVDQLNLYFEYQNSWFPEIDEYFLLYSQGIQYAKNRTTIEAAIQFPLIQKLNESSERRYSIYLGARYIL